MPGRGDNNNHGSSGQGASNQSGQGLERKVGKVNRGSQTGGQPSEQQGKQRDQSSDQNQSTDRAKPSSR